MTRFLCIMFVKVTVLSIWGALSDESTDIKLYKDPVRTSQEINYVSATKPNRLMLFRETVAVCCEKHTEHTDTLCGVNA
jgi:hypothetical protein